MAPDVLALLTDQCPELGLADVETANVRAGLSSPKVAATIAYRPHHAEIERRQAAGLDSVTNIGHLDLMMELPHGLPVIPDRGDRRTLCRLPKGCIDITADGFIRQLVKPLDVRLAIVTARQWKPGLVRAGRFAPFCTRVLAFAGKPGGLTERAFEADYWGIGIVINTAKDPELVVTPEPFVARRHTPAGWAFAEDIYRQVAEAA